MAFKILLVDDRHENLLALEAILRDHDYELISTTSGVEALRIAMVETIAVIVLDVVMPDMDGFAVARMLKQTERTRHIPIVFLTAVATDVRNVYGGYDVGAVDYLIKPLDPEVVRRRVGVFVDLVRQREKVEEQAKLLRDVERREYELRLAELRKASDRRYRKVVEGIDHAIGWSATGPSLQVTFISRQAERILGVPSDHFLEPEFWAKHLHPDDRERVLDVFHKALAEGVDMSCDHRMLGDDGRLLWFHTSVSGEAGSAELNGVSSDVT
jgi:PAS domain S-box-containing protein